MTTTTGRSYLVTAIGAARAKSISFPKLYLASFADTLRIWLSLRDQLLAILAKKRNPHVSLFDDATAVPARLRAVGMSWTKTSHAINAAPRVQLGRSSRTPADLLSACCGR